MPTRSPLASQKIMAFVATANAAKARKFYRDTLGMRLLSEDSFALAFEVEGVMLRVQIVEKVAAAPYTALGWQVKDAAKTVKALQKAGVKFERYPGMGQDELGIWKSPAGAYIAWFKDPDGNTLSIAEM